MKKNTHKIKQRVKAPNAALYFALCLLLYPLFKLFFRLEIDRGEYRPAKGPFLVLSNHVSSMDFVLVMLAMYPHRLNTVTAHKYFLSRPLSWLLPFMGCIPKNMFDSDVRAVKGIMSVFKRGGRVLIFPEGRCSPDGEYAGVNKAIGKLIKKLEAPVISCRLDGVYTCWPGWRRGFRFGRIRVTLANLFEAEDAQRFTADEINAQIDARLSGEDLKPPEKPLQLFRTRRLAEGLDHFLYYCPGCEREFTLEAKGNIISCTACGNAAAMDRRAMLIPLSGGTVPETVHKWYKEQVVYEMRSVHADMEPVEIQVSVRIPARPGKGLTHYGRGTLFLDTRGWHYEGELDGEVIRLFFPLETVPAIPYNPNSDFQIYLNGNYYVFSPEDNPSACAKMAALGEGVYRRFSPFVQMTEGYDSGFSEELENICT